MTASPTLPMLELVPLDAPCPQTPARKAVATSLPGERDRTRLAYLRARFPGVIREEADLRDLPHVAGAARCYAADGRMDRARELAELAPSAFSPIGEFAHPDDRFSADDPQGPGDCASSGHAARIRRLLILGTDTQARTR